MYVKKYFSESLEGAIQQIKEEMGPEAIILKTVTNKGLKGKLKKNRIEITAAIAQKDYAQKAKVDKVLSSEEKENFYKNDSQHINQMIEKYGENDLNRGKERELEQVSSSSAHSRGEPSTKVHMSSPLKSKSTEFSRLMGGHEKGTRNGSEASEQDHLSGSALDKFLEGTTDYFKKSSSSSSQSNFRSPSSEKVSISSSQAAPRSRQSPTMDKLATIPSFEKSEGPQGSQKIQEHELSHWVEKSQPAQASSSIQFNEKLESSIQLHEVKLKEIEKQLENLRLEEQQDDNYQLKAINQYLTGLSLDRNYIHQLIRKMTYHFSDQKYPESNLDKDAVFDFAAKDIIEKIVVKTPLFMSEEGQPRARMVLLISDGNSGQSTMSYKLTKYFKYPEIVALEDGVDQIKLDHISAILGCPKTLVGNEAELFTILRKKADENKDIIVDLKALRIKHRIKNLIGEIKKSFPHVEILLCLSSIHSEKYNMSIINSYKNFSDGVIINHLDLCVCFGSVFNLCLSLKNCPLMLFGTGPSVPQDVEKSHPSKILDNIFCKD